MMARAGGGIIIAKPNLLLILRSYGYGEANRGVRGLSKMSRKVEAAAAGSSSGGNERYDVWGESDEKNCGGGGGGGGGGTVWVPHERTGIYAPKGQEWVMKDVPENAATFTHTCWFRNDDLNHAGS